MMPYINILGRSIPMYGLCMTAGIFSAALICLSRLKKAKRDINSAIAIIATAALCGLIGAKILYIFSSIGIGQTFAMLRDGDFSAFTGGGQVYYGGLIFGIAGAFLGAKIAKEDISKYADAIISCLPIGHAFGRIGCFFAGCCYGKPYDGFCSVIFTASGLTYGVFPVQLLEAFMNVILFVILSAIYRRSNKSYFTVFVYLILYSLTRFFLEFLRGDAIRGSALSLSTSQWISAVVFVITIAAMCRMFIFKREKSKPDTE